MPHQLINGFILMKTLFTKRILEAQLQLGLTKGSTLSLINSIKAKSEHLNKPTVH